MELLTWTNTQDRDDNLVEWQVLFKGYLLFIAMKG